MSIYSREHVALLTDYDTNSAYSEAYQTLYANIHLNWKSKQQQFHTLLLTSPSPFAEQATVAANVAIAAARTGTPTILVDANLRSPSLQQRFDLKVERGLYELLISDTITAQDVEASLVQTSIPRVRLLETGTTTEEEPLFSTEKLQVVIEKLQQVCSEVTQPGLIIFHGPAVLSGLEASLLGALVEQTVLTVVAGRTTRAQATQAEEQLQQTHAHVTGVVVLHL